MALFNKEPEKPKIQPPKPVTPIQSVTPTAPPYDETVPPKAATPSAQTFSTNSEGRAYLDNGCKISGKLFFEGPVKIDGQVDGQIDANDSVFIGESAVVTAQIKAASVAVAGKVSGDIVATKRIEIRPSAKVLGNLTTPVLVVHEGAVFEGHCAMQADHSRDERKVTLFAKEERVANSGGQKPA
ncbi:MAG: polymer-forming cytoskeletal protein [Candidatus Binataceae bacterium]|jgi:cytoskeletal protein CcmA (bactofilin family)